MPALAYGVLSFLIFHPVIAVPMGPQATPTTTVSQVLRPLMQKAIDFLNPHHPPSLNQAVISCLTFLFISAYIIYCILGINIKGGGASLLSRLRRGITIALVCLLSPDFMGFRVFATAFVDFFTALAYNELAVFHAKDKKKAWTGAHIAFLRHGGFVLQEDGKQTKVLRFGDLVSMIKAGEVERPDVSRADILAKSICPSTTRNALNWLFPPLSYWFTNKFAIKLPLVVMFVYVHGMLTWVALLVCSNATTGIKEPIIVIRKLQRETQDESVSRGGVNGLEGRFESKDTEDPADDEKMVEEMLIIVDSNEKGDVRSTTPSPDQTRYCQLPASSVKWLLTQLINPVLLVPLKSLYPVYSAFQVSLNAYWEVVSGPCHLGTLGNYIAMILENFITWIGFVVISWHVPFDVERKMWIVSSLFLLLQPLVLLLVRPQRIRMWIKESIREVIYVLYSFVYIVARLSIPFAALYSTRYAM